MLYKHCDDLPSVRLVEFLLLGNCYQVLSKEAVADPRPKHLRFGWWSSPVQLLPSL